MVVLIALFTAVFVYCFLLLVNKDMLAVRLSFVIVLLLRIGGLFKERPGNCLFILGLNLNKDIKKAGRFLPAFIKIKLNKRDYCDL